MFVGSRQSLSELTFTDEGAKDNGPSGAHTLLSSAAACGGREGEGKGAQSETPRHQSPGSGAARPATLRRYLKSGAGTSEIKGTERNKELLAGAGERAFIFWLWIRPS